MSTTFDIHIANHLVFFFFVSSLLFLAFIFFQILTVLKALWKKSHWIICIFFSSSKKILALAIIERRTEKQKTVSLDRSVNQPIISIVSSDVSNLENFKKCCSVRYRIAAVFFLEYRNQKTAEEDENERIIQILGVRKKRETLGYFCRNTSKSIEREREREIAHQ